MSIRKLLHSLRPTAPRLAAGLGAAMCVLAGLSTAAPAISDLPLSVGSKVPSNLLLVPSLEFPTMINAANTGSTYNSSTAYTGYFDSAKCYRYHYVAVETTTDVRHFYPTGAATNRTCGGTAWSGNWLNWATTQAIDPFRKVLTGGYRVVDTATTTILEKAWADGHDTGGTYFPNRTISNNTAIAGATPTGWSSFTSGVRTLGNKLRFTSSATATLLSATPVPYIPASTSDPVPVGGFLGATVYEVTVRVKVCVTGLLEPGDYCKAYGSNYKPEGVIQQYATQLRYSAFGYLNDSSSSRDGGVLRANQKFVGPTRLNPSTNNWETNPATEWDGSTGVFYDNPDSSSAPNSGVINYINKGGQTTGADHKAEDPVSELYYTAIRYLKRLGNVSAYSALPDDPTARNILSDRFPVITNWDDPIQYSCQKNSILGIGDANTWNDKNLPGNQVTSSEPTMPTEVSADTSVNVVTATQKVAELEGITINTPFTGRGNSAYLAGLAYDSHTVDLRGDVTGKQTVSTYWMDVREAGVLQSPATNQFWLAAKYGGFAVPDNYQPYVNTTALAQDLWTKGDTISGTAYLRPENFFVASDASSSNTMMEGLQFAFARVASEVDGSATSLAANSTRLDAETRTFQAQFYTGTWKGDLSSYAVAANGALSAAPLWRAAAELDTRLWSNRVIKSYDPAAAANAQYVNFQVDGIGRDLGTAQLALLGANLTEQTKVVNYLRGERANESSQLNGTLRTRSSVLGDIVNSTPTFVGKPNQSLYAAATFDGADEFGDWANSTAILARTPMVYVGANDGMLHGFNANTGAEVYAYIPNTVIANLKQYTNESYAHRHYVDGDVAVADVYINNSWKTVLVGTLGRGGRGVFALDVTDPSNVGFLWEKNSTDIPALGNNIGRPVIAQVADGDWRVLIGNGPNSNTETAQLVMIDIDDGQVRTVTTGASGANGLTAVLARDSGNEVLDYFADTAYAGDLQGNLWKFTNLASASPTVTKMFQAVDPLGNAQPITSAPVVARNPLDSSLWVFFGTGLYLAESDLLNTQTQSWYGVRDSGTLATRANMVQRQVLTTGQIGQFGVRTISEGTAADLTGKDGWYLDLPSSGERMVVPNRIQGTAVVGTTRTPTANNICQPGGTGYVMAIDPFTGARLPNTYFDANGDGIFNDSDKLSVAGTLTVVSGIGFDVGANNPIFVEGIMQVGMDDGSTRIVKTQGSSNTSRRLGWREILN